ncbi:FGGY family carbohydrate kinase [Flavitalea sp. BT771]|uniref:FGGY-family carbohydrate kinase n=1 Tax=Flavitalea sp. BT771 TaxID=3063329 RepID=UPI0026E1FE34|nr:FGGY family carbohydrate kinase [Flavitalea sp. BT771]MDO6434905.1 FGGY family carbohydrate kinase [Flavitalea sp. BT771]MDV6223805.1 FGGY family carbohydrate kinase [Flavitalea sp. BT771]
MGKKEGYIVIDIGTGNLRVALVTPVGEVVGVGREDIGYIRDVLYPDALYFDPGVLWQQIVRLTTGVLRQAAGWHVSAVTATSQREGIVLVDHAGKALIGLPNIDHRGREWEDMIKDKHRMYREAGRQPSSLFSALKVVGIRERRAAYWEQMAFFLSISDWVEYQLSGVAKYEHSQASETLLYDVARGGWSAGLAEVFGLDGSSLPALMDSGTVLGKVLSARASELMLPEGTQVVAGGGDTQLAIKSTRPSVEDIVIVSGTTTPIVKLVDQYVTDDLERTWTSRDIEKGQFVFEANAGVTGLNYQRLKEIFYPNEGYEVIEAELAANPYCNSVASLGSLIAGEDVPVRRGGFIFPTPVTHELTRSCFVRATLFDIASSIAANYQVLSGAARHDKEYVWACGGGMQSPALRQMIANVLRKEVKVRPGFQQASVVGGALICNEGLGRMVELPSAEEVIVPEGSLDMEEQYEMWRQTRERLRS